MVSLSRGGAALGRVVLPPRASRIEVACDFLYAGSSALLLLVPVLRPELWMLAFLALTPLFYRLVRIPPGQAARVGVLFGLSYFTVYLSGTFAANPLGNLATLGVGTSLLAAFAWVVTRAQARIGFNPLITAFLWFLLEAILIWSGLGNGLVSAVPGPETVFAQGSVLFGFLFTTFVIVFINALVVFVTGTMSVLIPGCLIQWVTAWQPCVTLSVDTLPSQSKYLTTESRGPPWATTPAHALTA